MDGTRFRFLVRVFMYLSCVYVKKIHEWFSIGFARFTFILHVRCINCIFCCFFAFPTKKTHEVKWKFALSIVPETMQLHWNLLF